ncbi:MAG: hypothetical protein J6U54_09285 [Clostridiales bacterium]|nr:hypothetical protein [Clostridiales bacterium]
MDGGRDALMTSFFSDNKIAETSSKGNQEKCFAKGRWYKLDQFGYEGLSEVLVSSLLEFSTIEHDSPFSFVRYKSEKMNVHGIERAGCSSKNFLKKDQAICTLSHLFRNAGMPLSEALKNIPSDRQRLRFVAEKTAELTGLSMFPQYLTLLFEIDALFLNDDRHFNNIAVMEKNGQFDYCPIFDNGAALLSNTMDNPLDIDPRALIKNIKARPFVTTFNRQVIAATSLYGKQLNIKKFSEKEIREILSIPLSFYASRDRSYIADRVVKTILTRQRAKS